MKTIVVAEDSRSIRESLCQALREAGHTALGVEDGAEALKTLKEKSVDILITDLRMPKMDGLALLRRVKRDSPNTYVVLITAFGSVETAVEAMKSGACDYVTKPFSIDEIELIVKKIEKEQQLIEEREYLRSELKGQYEDFENMIANGEGMEDVNRIINKVARTDSAVLIRGESGTGKELVAMAIHYRSPRKDKPLIKINCAALPETLLESELFGHEKGAFTGAIARRKGRFELAHKGTLFLDEIGDMRPTTQLKLLRVLQENQFERVGGTETLKVEVRIIAATRQDLERGLKEGSFREDLYYRLNVVPIFLPPLRKRRRNIPSIANHFLKRYNRQAGKDIERISSAALELLMECHWPGNIRELENAIERAVVLAEGNELLPEHLALGMPQRRRPRERAKVRDLLYNLERGELIEALKKSNWVKSKAAQILGLPRSSLSYKMRKLRLIEERHRLSCSLPVDCSVASKVLGKKFAEPFKISTRDIGHHGLCLEWPKKLRLKGCSYCLDWLFQQYCELRKCPYVGKDEGDINLLELGIGIRFPSSSRPLMTKAKVVWVGDKEDENYRVGVCFTKISKDDNDKIINFLHQNDQKLSLSDKNLS